MAYPPHGLNIATSNTQMVLSILLIHLNKNKICGKSYNDTKLKILRSCNNIFDLIELEAKNIH